MHRDARRDCMVILAFSIVTVVCCATSAQQADSEQKKTVHISSDLTLGPIKPTPGSPGFSSYLEAERTDDGPVSAEDLIPPVAMQRPQVIRHLGHEWTDDYHYFTANERELRESTSESTIDYLRSENQYANAVLADYRDDTEKIAKEMKARIKPFETFKLFGEYKFYRKFDANGEPCEYGRRHIASGEDRVFLDEKKLAEASPPRLVTKLTLSDDNQMLAFLTHAPCQTSYTIRFWSFSEDRELSDSITTNILRDCAWAKDNQTFFYTRCTNSGCHVFRHRIGEDSARDQKVFTQNSSILNFLMHASKDFIFLTPQRKGKELYYLSRDEPEGKFAVFSHVDPGYKYKVKVSGSEFFILTNWNARNFRLMKVAGEETSREHWEEVVPHREDVFVENVTLLDEHLVLFQRRNGLQELQVIPREHGSLLMDQSHTLGFDEVGQIQSFNTAVDTSTDLLRFSFSSFVTPHQVIEYNMRSREKKIVMKRPIGDYDPANYTTGQLWAKARDGVKVPISVVYRRDTKLNGKAPCLLYGYGWGGISKYPDFAVPRLSLLDRGFVFAIAHVRGGQVMGSEWYEDGKQLNKMNSFTDFIDAGKHLIAEKYADPKRLYAQGGSAGGLLVGGVMNMEPELFHGVIANVPLADPLADLLDNPKNPVLVKDLGSPDDPATIEQLLSYSPYHNVREITYPHLLVTAGIQDRAVDFWQPAKWVARLRDRKKGNNLILFRTMDAGHGGKFGQANRREANAIHIAFLLRLAGIAP